MPDIFSEFTWNILYIRIDPDYWNCIAKPVGSCSPGFNLTEIKFRISTRWDLRFILPYQCSEVGLELDGGSIQVINLSEIISLEGGDDVCGLGSIFIFMFNII